MTNENDILEDDFEQELNSYIRDLFCRVKNDIVKVKNSDGSFTIKPKSFKKVEFLNYAIIER